MESKNGIGDFTCEAEIKTQMQTIYGYQGGREYGRNWETGIDTIICTIDTVYEIGN